jgi:hypothetical protein
MKEVAATSAEMKDAGLLKGFSCLNRKWKQDKEGRRRDEKVEQFVDYFMKCKTVSSAGTHQLMSLKSQQLNGVLWWSTHVSSVFLAISYSSLTVIHLLQIQIGRQPVTDFQKHVEKIKAATARRTDRQSARRRIISGARDRSPAGIPTRSRGSVNVLDHAYRDLFWSLLYLRLHACVFVKRLFDSPVA